MTAENKISVAQFTRLWNDPSLRKIDVALRAGFKSIAPAVHRAKRLGLPDRPQESPGRRQRIADRELFTAMWNEGVYVRDMSSHFGVTPPTVSLARKRWGLESRPEGRFVGISLRTFLRRRKVVA